MLADLGRDSVVGIETCYILYGPGITSRGGGIFRIRSEWPWGPPSLLYRGQNGFQR